MTTHANILDEIQALLAAPAVADASNVARIEHTLTTGYASALALEAERWRIERRISEVAALLGDDDGRKSELVSLAARLSNADGKLSTLRSALATLRERAAGAKPS